MSANVFRCGSVMLMVWLGAAGFAFGQESDFSLSAGYSHAYGTTDSIMHSKDGAYLDSDFAWQLPNVQVPVMLGFGVTGSGYFNSNDDYGGYDDGYGYYGNNLYSDVGFFEFEPRVALTLWSKDIRGLFLKPRFGLGVLVNNYAVDEVDSSSGYVYTHYHTGAAFEIRPSVQAGYTWGFGSAGVEASYMPAWGDFGQLGSKIQELRVGGFFTLRF